MFVPLRLRSMAVLLAAAVAATPILLLTAKTAELDAATDRILGNAELRRMSGREQDAPPAPARASRARRA